MPKKAKFVSHRGPGAVSLKTRAIQGGLGAIAGAWATRQYGRVLAGGRAVRRARDALGFENRAFNARGIMQGEVELEEPLLGGEGGFMPYLVGEEAGALEMMPLALL